MRRGLDTCLALYEERSILFHNFDKLLSMSIVYNHSTLFKKLTFEANSAEEARRFKRLN